MSSKEPTLANAYETSRSSLRWLVTQYLNSPEYRRLAKATQVMRRQLLNKLCEKHGEKRFSMLLPKHVRMLREEKAATPHGANNLLKILSTFFQWSIEAGYMENNPVRKVKRLPDATDGYYTWTMTDVLKFLKRHPPHTKAGLALCLMFFLGVRRSDLVKLGPHMETEDGGIRFLETKDCLNRPKITELSIQPELRAVLDLHESEKRKTYISTIYGTQYSLGGLGHWFKRKCIEADLPHCTPHGLRKAAATMVVSRGATERQLMAMFGWTSTTSIRTYLHKMDRKKLAAEAGTLVSLEGFSVGSNPARCATENTPAVARLRRRKS